MKSKLFLTAALLAAAPLVNASSISVQTPGATAKKAEQPVTVTGCVQRESDYRKAHDKGKGGAAGTGIGAGDEFVLTNVSTSSADKSMAYELTGPNEEKLKAHVGHRVEVTGNLKAADVSASGPTGGPTAGKPPSGVDVMSKDLQLRELEISSVKMISADCSK